MKMILRTNSQVMSSPHQSVGVMDRDSGSPFSSARELCSCSANGSSISRTNPIRTYLQASKSWTCGVTWSTKTAIEQGIVNLFPL